MSLIIPLETVRKPALISFEDATFSYGPKPAVEHISFSVHRGDYLALIGPNGSGKTTLVKLALGLERPQRGKVLLFGQAAHTFHDWRRIGYVPQSANAMKVNFPATVAEVVAYGEYKGFDPLAIFRHGISASTERALKAAGMWESRNRLISELSGGQQRRVLIARALVADPELLILDEPTVNLDAAAQDEFYALLRRLRQDRGVTIMLVSHDIGLLLQEATNVACVNCQMHCYRPAEEITTGDLSHLYGSSIELIVNRKK